MKPLLINQEEAFFIPEGGLKIMDSEEGMRDADMGRQRQKLLQTRMKRHGKSKQIQRSES